MNALDLLGLFKSDSPAFHITDAEADDLAACAGIHAAGFSEPWGDGELASMIKSPGTTLLVARAARPAAHPVRAMLMYREAGKEAEVLTIAVHPDLRRRGAARMLLEEMIRRCLSNRLEEIFLEVDAANEAATALYRRLGFVKVGERAGYYKDGGTDGLGGNAHILRLDLTG